MKNKILVIDTEGQVLFSCDVQQKDKAYEFATSMENYGVEVKIIAPSLPETLITALGAGETDLSQLQQIIEDEISSHN